MTDPTIVPMTSSSQRVKAFCRAIEKGNKDNFLALEKNPDI